MDKITKITLIRHGETEWNLSGRWQGHADSPLSDRGVLQAKSLGQRMKSEQFDYFYSSDLGRAMHTARLVGEPSGVSAVPFEGLRERDLGVLEGLNTTELKESQPDVYKSFREGGADFEVPGGESFRQFYQRCAGSIADISNRHPGAKIALVTHGGFLGCIFRYVLKIPLESERNFVLLNCSLNKIEKKNELWNLISWGDVAHLNNLDSLDDA
jgi:probable phosphoglycerate mutase